MTIIALCIVVGILVILEIQSRVDHKSFKDETRADIELIRNRAQAALNHVTNRTSTAAPVSSAPQAAPAPQSAPASQTTPPPASP